MLVNGKKDNRKIEEFLELLGNESRRKIIELLTKKPCYISEISYSLRMAPKVVLEHLEKLEKAGIVKSYEEGRRRYYCINKAISINITLTPHRFNISCYEEKECKSGDILAEIKSFLNELNSFEKSFDLFDKISEVEKSFRALHGEIIERIDKMIDKMILELDRLLDEDIDKVVMYGIIKGLNTPEKIAQIFNLPYDEVAERFEALEKRGMIIREERNGRIYWKLVWR